MEKAFGRRAQVVLQKRVSDRKLLEEGIAYAATPHISAMNFTRSLTAPFSTPVATTERSRRRSGSGEPPMAHWLNFFHLSLSQHVHGFVTFYRLP